MVTLDDLRISLEGNTNISKEVKDHFLELTTIFHNKFPQIDLTNLNNKLKNIRVEKMNKFLNHDVSFYDCHQNILNFNSQEMNKDYDMKHILMYELLNIISSNNIFTGFNYNNRFEALNTGYTEILANFLVGNESDSLVYPDEAVYANLTSILIGNDNMFDSYFNNNVNLLLNSMMKAGIEI